MSIKLTSITELLDIEFKVEICFGVDMKPTYT